jgi:hypothetical protein
MLMGVDAPEGKDELKDDLKKIRENIVTSNEADFQTRKKMFEKKDEKKVVSDTNLQHFLIETKTICDNYEYEIETLKEQIFNLAKISTFDDLDISTNQELEFLPQQSKVFLNQINNKIAENSDIAQISTIYSEKITELFEENEKLQNQLKNFLSDEKELKDLREKLKLKEKEENDIHSK